MSVRDCLPNRGGKLVDVEPALLLITEVLQWCADSSFLIRHSTDPAPESDTQATWEKFARALLAEIDEMREEAARRGHPGTRLAGTTNLLRNNKNCDIPTDDEVSEFVGEWRLICREWAQMAPATEWAAKCSFYPRVDRMGMNKFLLLWATARRMAHRGQWRFMTFPTTSAAGAGGRGV